VTHTAEVAVNSASTKDMRSPVADAHDVVRSKAPNKISPANPKTRI